MIYKYNITIKTGAKLSKEELARIKRLVESEVHIKAVDQLVFGEYDEDYEND